MPVNEEILITIKSKSSEAEKGLDNIKKKTKETKNEAKDLASEFSVMGVSISSLKGAFTKVQGVAKGMFTSIKMGIASTGIGLLVLAVGSLVTYFTQTKRGAEQLQVAFKAVGATISVLTDRISQIGGAIVKVFKGDFKGAAEDAKSAVKGVTTEIVEETKQMIGLTKAQQELRDSQRELNIETAKRRSEVQALKLIAEDTTKTEKERLDAAEKAFKIEKELTDKRVENAQIALDIKRQEVEASESTAEDLDELAQLEIDLFNIQEESVGKQIELNNKVNSIRAEGIAKRQAEADAEQARIDEQNQKKLDAEKKLADEKTKIAAKEAADKIALDKKVAADAKAAQQARMQGLMTGLSTAQDVFGKESAAGKAAAIAQATINTYQAASKALAQFGVPVGIPFAALAVAAGLKQVNAIVSTPEPQLARGGVVRGAGTGTSDSISARLSKGETVINARSTRMFKPLLSAINEAGGGVGFANGGTLDTGTGGATIGAIKAFVVTDDITESQNNLSKIRQKATI